MKKLIPVMFAATLSGCCAFNATDYPQVAVVAPKGDAAKLSVAVTGFEAVVTEYESAYGYSTVYVPGYIGRRHYHPGGSDREVSSCEEKRAAPHHGGYGGRFARTFPTKAAADANS